MPPSQGGVLLIAKPAGPTSHDLVAQVRRSDIARGMKVGHAGTLDPFATGLLLILVGSATRFQRYLMSLPKTYRAVARFGATSDTGDRTGTVEATGHRASEEAVRRALPALSGRIEQRVPLVSAVKVGGERLYRKARRGEAFETPIRAIEVHALRLEGFDEAEQRANLVVECSSGTYVRQLVADLGEITGAGAYCEQLERTRIGPFDVRDADAQNLIGLADALSFMPERKLSAAEAVAVRNGVALAAGESDQGLLRLTEEGALVAVAESEGGHLRPRTVVSGP